MKQKIEIAFRATKGDVQIEKVWQHEGRLHVLSHYILTEKQNEGIASDIQFYDVDKLLPITPYICVTPAIETEEFYFPNSDYRARLVCDETDIPEDVRINGLLLQPVLCEITPQKPILATRPSTSDGDYDSDLSESSSGYDCDLSESDVDQFQFEDEIAGVKKQKTSSYTTRSTLFSSGENIIIKPNREDRCLLRKSH